MENNELQKYIPDDICPTNLSREYLLSASIYDINIFNFYILQVLAFVDNKQYLTLYESYKQIKEERQAKKWGDFEINVINGVKGILENYKSVDEQNGKISKPLRFSKNHKEVGFVSKIEEKNKKEKIQNVPKAFNPLSMVNQNNILDLEDNDE